MAIGTASAALRIAADVGGTFTDIAVFDEASGQIRLGKTLTTPARLIEGMSTGVAKAEAEKAGLDVKAHVVAGLTSGRLHMACEDPDNPKNFPRNLFIWRSNLFGSSGKGHEYFLRHFLGTRHGLQGKDLGEMDGVKPEEVVWRDPTPEGKLDLVVTLDFRMSTSCLYSDVVLPIRQTRRGCRE